MNKIARLMAERIAGGLKRKSIVNCAKWAEEYRVMGAPFPGRWGWENHPWLYEPHTRDAAKYVAKKSAQMGFTQWALNQTFFAMDVGGVSVLYILPSDSDASDFSADRFDKALENSNHLSNFFSDVRNVGHKRAGNSSLFVRGSHSRSKLKSIDTAIIVFDEMDEMTQDNIPLAYERQSGQRIDTKKLFFISTPTTSDFGVDLEFQSSSQEHYNFKCPGCNKFIEFTYPESFIVVGDSEIDPRIGESHYICKECKRIITQEEKKIILQPQVFGGSGIYIPHYVGRDTIGYHISQFYSMTISPKELAQAHFRGLRDPTSQTEFFNSKLGLTCSIPGAKVTDADIANCMGSHIKGNSNKHYIRTMGIDVGAVCHFSIEEWIIESGSGAMMINDRAKPFLLWEGETSGSMNDFNELDELMRKFQIDGCVIDSEPERRVAQQFARKHWGRVYLCDWVHSQQGRQLTMQHEEETAVKANRTSWLDVALARFRTGSIILPQDVSYQYKSHIKSPERVYKKDKYGNPYGSYQNSTPDHLAFTRVYNEIALNIVNERAANSTNLVGVI